MQAMHSNAPSCNGVFYELIPPGQISCSNALFELVGAISEATQRTLQAVRGCSSAVSLILLFAPCALASAGPH